MIQRVADVLTRGAPERLTRAAFTRNLKTGDYTLCA